MSTSGSLMAEDDETFIREVIYIMIVWTIAVVAAGILLVLIRDPFSGVFAFTGLY